MPPAPRVEIKTKLCASCIVTFCHELNTFHISAHVNYAPCRCQGQGFLKKSLGEEAVRGLYNSGEVALHLAKGHIGMHVEY
jgi:hypothetical protein